MLRRCSAAILILLVAVPAAAKDWTAFDQDGPRKAVARVINWAEGYHHGAFYSGTGTLTAVHGKQGVILTAAHIFEGKQGPLTVEFYDGQISGARLAAIDTQLDVAALVIFAPKNIDPVPLDDTNPRLGDRVEIWGYGPKKFRSFLATVSTPIQLTTDEPETLIGARGVENGEVTIPGDSGGPMIRDGKLVGVHWGYRGAETDPRRCVHGLGCRSIVGWMRSKLTRWSPESAAKSG